MRTLLMVQLAATLLMAGIIWFVQIVHYPLFLRMAPDSFAHFEAEHATRTGWVIGPLMCAELAAAVLTLAARFRPASIPHSQALLGLALVAVIWLSTALIQVPLHNRLGAGYDAAVIRTLIATNWIRTIAWTARALLLLTWMA